jgi:iron-sulfur cluster assembly protein
MSSNVSSNENKLPITVTDSALRKLSELLKERQKTCNTLGVKIKVVSKGCGGNKYKMEYVDQEDKYDEIIELMHDGTIIKIFLDPKALLKVIGTVMDHENNKFETGFSFKNKREKGRCGCGESFYY